MRKREFVKFMAAVSSGGTFFGNTVRLMAASGNRVTREMVIEAEKMAGIKFTKSQREMMIPTLQNYVQNVQYIRQISLPPHAAPRLYFLTNTKGLWTVTSKKLMEG